MLDAGCWKARMEVGPCALFDRLQLVGWGEGSSSSSSSSPLYSCKEGSLPFSHQSPVFLFLPGFQLIQSKQTSKTTYFTYYNGQKQLLTTYLSHFMVSWEVVGEADR